VNGWVSRPKPRASGKREALPVTNPPEGSSARSVYADRLLAPLTPDQQWLLDLVAEVLVSYGNWPVYEYVAGQIDDRGLDTDELLASFPRLPSGRYANWYYAALTYASTRPPTPESRVALTILGLNRSRQGSNIAGRCLALLRALTLAKRGSTMDPTTVTPRPVVSLEALHTSTFPELPEMQARVLLVLQTEPSTAEATQRQNQEGQTVFELSRTLLRFQGVTTIEEYVERLVDLFAPKAQTIGPKESPFDLPAAIDYLDAIWYRRFNSALVKPPGVERSSRLVLTPTSPADFDSRVSVLAEVLKTLQVPGVPGVGGAPLARLVPFLEQHLPPESIERISAEVAVLNAARQVRVSSQHVGGNIDLVTALRQLGIQYPITDWGAAWAQLAERVAASFNAIREEIQAAGDNPSTPDSRSELGDGAQS